MSSLGANVPLARDSSFLAGAPSGKAGILAHTRQALSAAGLRPGGRDPLGLTDAETEDALHLLSVRVAELHAAAMTPGLSETAYYLRLAAAMREITSIVS